MTLVKPGANNMKTFCGRVLLTSLLLSSLCASTLRAQQVADPNFDTRVNEPSYTRNFPRVLFDEGHNNFHTSTGRYKPFADLIFSDGYQVVVNRKPFTKQAFKTFKILVIANALGAEDLDEEGSDKAAFTTEEVDAVYDWVRDGGALLLIADHAPFGSAAEILAQKFGVEMSKTYTVDAANSDPDSNIPGFIVYSRDNKLLLDHSITNGRNGSEKVNRIVTFTGQSLKGPAPAEVFLKLSDTAKDTVQGSSETTSAAGKAQGLALRAGKGRVVILGEAAMLSAQLTGHDNRPFGMNIPGNDNKQLALNIMHWLSGLLK